ncbi:hypothetical protein [Brachybacterium sp. NPDC056505]|uniref:hypothetical protein n=1 Tax=Brachybacterium sp. NPDC056505 TaxID=3345843 RepID=UPI0036730744
MDFWELPLLIGLMGLFFQLCIGIAQLCTAQSIKAPRPMDFSEIRSRDLDFRGIIAPAMAALFSGVLVSVSASYFYDSIGSDHSRALQVWGMIFFAAATITLGATLHYSLKDGGSAEGLARNPHTIEAAAREVVRNPEEPPVPSARLSKQLDQWEASIGCRALQFSGNHATPALNSRLESSLHDRTFVQALLSSWSIYWFACAAFKIRAGWPVLMCVTYIVGVTLLALEEADFRIDNAVHILLTFSALVGVGIIILAFYALARGNYARRWHAVNVEGLRAARSAIAESTAAERDATERHAARMKALDTLCRLIEHTPNIIHADLQFDNSASAGIGIRTGSRLLGKIRNAVRRNM